MARRLEASAIGQFSQKALPTLSWHHGTWEPVSSQHDTHTIHTHLEHSPPPQGADLFFKGHSSLLNNSMAVFLLSGQTCFPVFTSRVVGGSSTIFCRHSCTQSAEIHTLFRVLPQTEEQVSDWGRGRAGIGAVEFPIYADNSSIKLVFNSYSKHSKTHFIA